VTAPLDITAIVVAYRSAETIAATVAALETALGHLRSEIVVVDNASGDGTDRAAAAVIGRGRVIANAENVGYARAVNAGLRVAAGRYALIMNDDARIDARSVDRLIAVLASNPDVGLVGPRIVDPAGRPMPSARFVFPGPRAEIARLLSPRRQRGAPGPASSGEPAEAAWLVGACLLSPTELLRRAGGFNEAFFLYGEDIDLGRRLHALGLRRLTVPDATCVHVGGVATAREYDEDARGLRQVSGRAVYYRIWHGKAARVFVYLARIVGLRHQPFRLKTFLPLVFREGPSLHEHRFPPALTREDRMVAP